MTLQTKLKGRKDIYDDIGVIPNAMKGRKRKKLRRNSIYDSEQSTE
jgi:hypothetical protein